MIESATFYRACCDACGYTPDADEVSHWAQRWYAIERLIDDGGLYADDGGMFCPYCIQAFLGSLSDTTADLVSDEPAAPWAVAMLRVYLAGHVTEGRL